MDLMERNIYNGLDMYREQSQLVFTRRQIGESLGYKEPRKAIENIHTRHREELENFCSVLTVRTEAGNRDVFCYNLTGTMRICVYSSQPKAKELLIVLTDKMQEVINSRIAKIDPEYIPDLDKVTYARLPEAPEINGNFKAEKKRAANFILSYIEKNGSFAGIYRAYRLHCKDIGEIPIGKSSFDNIRIKIRDGIEYF